VTPPKRMENRAPQEYSSRGRGGRGDSRGPPAYRGSSRGGGRGGNSEHFNTRDRSSEHRDRTDQRYITDRRISSDSSHHAAGAAQPSARKYDHQHDDREHRLSRGGAPGGFQISSAKAISTVNYGEPSSQVVKSQASVISQNSGGGHAVSQSQGKTIIKVERSNDGYMYNGELESSFPATTPKLREQRSRDRIRRTLQHNTVTIPGFNPSAAVAAATQAFAPQASVMPDMKKFAEQQAKIFQAQLEKNIQGMIQNTVGGFLPPHP